jgi:hypothetical protein
VLLKRTWRRRVAPWHHVEHPPRYSLGGRTLLPVRLEDGNSYEGHIDAEDDDAR